MAILTVLTGASLAAYCITILVHSFRNPWFVRNSAIEDTFHYGLFSDLAVGVMACIMPFVGTRYGMDDVVLLLTGAIRANFLFYRVVTPSKHQMTRYFFDSIMRAGFVCALIGSLLPLYFKHTSAAVPYGLQVIGWSLIIGIVITATTIALRERKRKLQPKSTIELDK